MFRLILRQLYSCHHLGTVCGLTDGAGTPCIHAYTGGLLWVGGDAVMYNWRLCVCSLHLCVALPMADISRLFCDLEEPILCADALGIL